MRTTTPTASERVRASITTSVTFLKWLADKLIVPVLLAVVAFALGPYVSQHWQDHHAEISTKATMVDAISHSSAELMSAVETRDTHPELENTATYYADPRLAGREPTNPSADRQLLPRRRNLSNRLDSILNRAPSLPRAPRPAKARPRPQPNTRHALQLRKHLQQCPNSSRANLRTRPRAAPTQRTWQPPLPVSMATPRRLAHSPTRLLCRRTRPLIQVLRVDASPNTSAYTDTNLRC